MLKDVHHVVYVVANLEKTMGMFSRVFGMEPTRRLTVEKTGQDIALYEMESGATIEIIMPLKEESVWAEFLRQHGDGVQLVGYTVDGVNQRLRELESKGVELADREARVSPIGWKVANIVPRSTNGLRFQMYEPPLS